MKVVRATGSVFILIGLTMLLFVGYELIGTSIVTNHHQSALAAEFDPLIKERVAPPVLRIPPKPFALPRLKGPKAVARLRIPKIRLSKIVVEGTSLYALAFGPGHYVGTPLPGQKGSVAMACHRTGWGSPCINLDKLRGGDLIYLDTPSGTYTYRVTTHRTVEPGDVWVLNGDPKSKALNKLTLTTCTPKYTSLHRLIYWADQISPLPSGAA